MPIDVASYLKFTPTDNTGSFAADTEGHVYYDDSEASLKHYDGSNWGRVSRDLTWGITPGYGPYTVDDNTKLLIHSDTTDDNTTFDDSSSSDHTITRSNALHKTAQKKIGATSMYFDGDGDYLSIPDHNDFDWGNAADFTIDFWMKALDDTALYPSIISCVTGWGGCKGLIYFDGATEILYFTNIAGMSVQSNDTLQDSVWHHIACIRDSTVFKMYVDGVAQSDTDSGQYDFDISVGGMTIGKNSWNGEDGELKGYLDEIRFSNIARWTSNFTVY